MKNRKYQLLLVETNAPGMKVWCGCGVGVGGEGLCSEAVKTFLQARPGNICFDFCPGILQELLGTKKQ
jgi:hypothetical protein